MDAETKELFGRLADVLERNTAAMEQVAKAVENNADKNQHLGGEMKRLVGVITGWQGMIGGKLGPVLDKQRETLATLNAEADLARESRLAVAAKLRGKTR